MTGLELFYQEANNRQFVIGETNTSKGEENGDFLITNKIGKTCKQNYKKIADIYGTLTFYHFEPEEAIKELFQMIEISFENNIS